MSFNDYVRFLTEQFVTYIDQPKEKREERKRMKKQLRQPVQNQLFGLIPTAISFFIRHRHSNKKRR